MPHNYYSLHNFVDRSLLVTSHQIRSLLVTFSGSYFTPPHNDLTHGKSIPSIS